MTSGRYSHGGSGLAALLLLLPALLIAVVPDALAASLQASINRQQLTMDQSFTLVITADGITGDLDLEPLSADFQILGTSQSREIKIINGKTTDVQKWNVDLLPARPGELVIPALTVNGLSTRAITIAVSEADPTAAGAADPEVFLEAEIDQTESFVQAQVIYTVRFFSAVRVVDGKLSEPAADKLKSFRLGDDTGYLETRDGRQYRVLERRYALFPQESGVIELAPMQLTVSVPADPNSSGGFFGQTKVLRRRGPALSLQVQPRPTPPPTLADGDPATQWWLPARSVELRVAWEGNVSEFRVGEAVTRVIEVKANAVASEQLPALQPPALETVKIYADKPEVKSEPLADSLVATRVEKWAMIPQVAGAVEVPAIEVHWFDTQSSSYQLATVPAQVINVLPAAGSDTSAQVNEGVAGASAGNNVQTGTAGNSGENLSGNINQDEQRTQLEKEADEDSDAAGGALTGLASGLDSKTNESALNDGSRTGRFWQWLALAALAGWLLTIVLGTLFGFRKFRRLAAGQSGSLAGSLAGNGNHAAVKDHTGRAVVLMPASSLGAVKTAARKGTASSLSAAILDWAGSVWPTDPPRSLQALAARCPDHLQNNLVEQLQTLDRQNFADSKNDSAPPDLKDLPAALEQLRKQLQRETGDRKSSRHGLSRKSATLPQL